MTSRRHRTVFLVVATLCVLAAAAVAAPLAAARTYTDVPAGHWARGAIDWVTDQGPAGDKVLDDFGGTFKPERAITRAQLARALVIASGHEGETVPPVTIPDMPPDLHPYYWDVQLALHYGFMGLITKNGQKGFYPDGASTASKTEVAIIRWLKQANAATDWSMLTTLKSGTWEPTAGWKPGVPSYFAFTIASRQLQLRFNHSSDGDAHEVTPNQAIDRAEVAYMFRKAYAASSSLWGIPKYADVILPALSDRQKEVLAYAFKYVGYPYIWAGEWPTKDSPYGHQAAGGFDCSGFTFYVMQCHFGYPVTGRGAGDQAKLRQAAHRPQQPQARGPHLLRLRRHQVDGGPDLSRRALHGEGLVHPLHRLQRRRDGRQPERPLQHLLEDVLRLGPPAAQAVGARRRLMAVGARVSTASLALPPARAGSLNARAWRPASDLP